MSLTRSSLRRTAGAGVVALGLAFSIAGCGGDSADGESGASADDSASVEDFCASYQNEAGGESYDDFVNALEQLAETGTPEDMPAEAREGFELLVDSAGSIDEAQFDELDGGGDPASLFDFTPEEEQKVAALGLYVGENCFPGGVPGAPQTPDAPETE